VRRFISIANQDIGFVNAGQRAVKFETFSGAKYGTVQTRGCGDGRRRDHRREKRTATAAILTLERRQ
jgi:hypothetical protein